MGVDTKNIAADARRASELSADVPVVPMRIAIIGSRGFPSTYGGYETLVRHLARALTLWGNDVTVYCRARHDKRTSWEVDGVRCRATPGRDTKSLSTLTFGATSCFDASLRGFDAAIVLNIANGLFLPLLRARGIPHALNTDGIEWERGKWGRVARLVFKLGARMSARYADSLVADSVSIAKIWHDLFGVDSTFVPYGAPIVKGTPSNRLKELGLTSESYVLAVARLIPENNVDLTLDAIERMSPNPPTVIVGSGSPGSPIERRLAALAERHDSFQWLGHVSDQELLTQLWANAGVYVHGHSVGGTNPALLQALGAGAPTLALDTPFNREVLQSDEQMVPGDAAVLADQLGHLLADAGAREHLRIHGRSVVRERYNWHDVCCGYLNVLERLLGRETTPAGVLPRLPEGVSL
jgi:glycosyltransferase involved in cell wall biosynthesis